MPDSSTISVIMPCYNEAKTITQSIQSVYNQTFSDFELIVVDDGSSDDSLRVLTQQKKLYHSLRIVSQPNRGAGPARNRGLKEAKGEMIAFLDADDSWHPECLEKLYRKLSQESEAVLVYCGWQNLGLNENQSKPFVPPDYERPDKIEVLLKSCRWPIHAALTRRSTIDRVNGFDERWTSCMDFDLWLRIGAFNKIVLVPEVLAYYHHHSGAQITKNRLRVALNHWRIQKKFIKSHRKLLNQLGRRKIRKIIHGELLRRAYLSYWKRDLATAQPLFRRILANLFFTGNDLKYLLPALLPAPIYKSLIEIIDQRNPNSR